MKKFLLFAVAVMLVVSLAPKCPEKCPRNSLTDSYNPEHLAIGDSILNAFWPTCKSIVDYAAVTKGEYIQNKSIWGAPLSIIETTYKDRVEGEWTTVIIDGGANDILQGCKVSNYCDIDCSAKVNSVFEEMKKLVNNILNSTLTTKVIILGYYQVLPHAVIVDCNPYVQSLTNKYQEFAATNARIFYFSTSPYMTADMYHEDGIHPNEKGCEILGKHLAGGL